MSQQFQFLDLIFLGIIVLLLVNRLRSVLGTRPTSDGSTGNRETKSAQVVDISEYRTIEGGENAKLEHDLAASGDFNEDSEVVKNLTEIKKNYPSFDLVDFMQKAPRAFEYIAKAFAEGDKVELEPLLSHDIYKSFEKVIDERVAQQETAEFTLIGFKSIKLLKSELIGSFAELTVEFETEQTNIIKDKDGNVIIGDPTYIETVTDIWTLRKDMKSNTPVWILTATHNKTQA